MGRVTNRKRCIIAKDSQGGRAESECPPEGGPSPPPARRALSIGPSRPSGRNGLPVLEPGPGPTKPPEIANPLGNAK